MGCDIHAYLEVKRYSYDDDKRENGIWVNADKWTVDESHIQYPEDYPNRFHIDYDDRIYSGRNYCLFAVLANVRNYWDEIKPISNPKGLPVDVSDETKQQSDDYGCDGHSHSYLTLKEILEYAGWNKEEEGTDFAFNEERLREAKDKYGEKYLRHEDTNFGYKVFYKTDIKELCSEFYNETIDKMKKYLKDHDVPKYQTREEDIRLVFFFDN
jgi:hypothetical protein